MRPFKPNTRRISVCPKILALPIFASDALSSTAYASEEIMAALLLSGSFLFGLTPALSFAIIVLLGIVVVSYRQIVMAYPSGGGAYIVAGDNLGPIPAQIAGASLLVDYVLTVAVSASAGVAAIVSLVKGFNPNSHVDQYTVPLCICAVLLIMLINLRGTKESGLAFAFPAYTFSGFDVWPDRLRFVSIFSSAHNLGFGFTAARNSKARVTSTKTPAKSSSISSPICRNSPDCS